MKWIKKRGIEDDFLNEPLAIQDLVQKRVIGKLCQELGEKMRFYQWEVNPMITCIEQQFLQVKIFMHRKTFILSIQIKFSAPSSGNQEMEIYKEKNIYA